MPTVLCIVLFVCSSAWLHLKTVFCDNDSTWTFSIFLFIYMTFERFENRQKIIEQKTPTLHQTVLLIVWMLFSPSKQTRLNPPTWWQWLNSCQDAKCYSTHQLDLAMPHILMSRFDLKFPIHQLYYCYLLQIEIDPAVRLCSVGFLLLLLNISDIVRYNVRSPAVSLFHFQT